MTIPVAGASGEWTEGLAQPGPVAAASPTSNCMCGGLVQRASIGVPCAEADDSHGTLHAADVHGPRCGGSSGERRSTVLTGAEPLRLLRRR